MALGQKAKLINAVDQAMADQLQTLYSIELNLAISPAKKNVCGAIVVYKLHNVMDQFDPDKKQISDEEWNELSKHMADQTQVMEAGPFYFKADDYESPRHMLGWAIDETMRLFDQYGTNADVAIKCRSLRVKHRMSRAAVLAGVGQERELFKTAFECVKLLRMGFDYDPVTEDIHRGKGMLQILKERR